MVWLNIFNLKINEQTHSQTVALKNVFLEFLKITNGIIKFIFSKKATKLDEIFTIDLTPCSQINGDDFVNFCSLLEKYELYQPQHKVLVANLESPLFHISEPLKMSPTKDSKWRRFLSHHLPIKCVLCLVKAN